MNKLNLYLIWQDTNTDWDTYDSAVVAAYSKREAQLTEIGSGYSWVTDKNLVNVKKIGIASRGIKPGIICDSFNAG